MMLDPDPRYVEPDPPMNLTPTAIRVDYWPEPDPPPKAARSLAPVLAALLLAVLAGVLALVLALVYAVGWRTQ